MEDEVLSNVLQSKYSKKNDEINLKFHTNNFAQ